MIAIFVFSNKSHGKLAKLSLNKSFKHCTVALNDGLYHYSVSLSRFGIIIHHLTTTSNEAFNIYSKQSNTEAIIAVEIHKPTIKHYCPIIVQTCNEIARVFSGINLTMCFTPFGLYKKLLKYDQTRDYTILAHWRRDNGK